MWSFKKHEGLGRASSARGEWSIGEAAGALAAFCLRCQEPPRQVRKNKTLLADFQALLERDGFELKWPKMTPRLEKRFRNSANLS